MKLLQKKSPSSILHGAREYCAAFRGLVTTFKLMDLGPFTQQHLRGALAAEPRTETVPSGSGCESCKGLLAFTSGRVYIENYLLDGAEPRIGGLKISRERLRSLIEMPKENLLKQFDESVESLRRYLPYEHLVEFDAATGLPEPVQSLVEQEAAQDDLFLHPRYEPVVEYLEGLAQQLSAGPEVLKKVDVKFTFAMESPRHITSAPPLNRFSGGGWELNDEWVLKTLSVPRRDLPKQ
jgi:hypothetical protein